VGKGVRPIISPLPSGSSERKLGVKRKEGILEPFSLSL